MKFPPVAFENAFADFQISPPAGFSRVDLGSNIDALAFVSGGKSLFIRPTTAYVEWILGHNQRWEALDTNIRWVYSQIYQDLEERILGWEGYIMG